MSPKPRRRLQAILGRRLLMIALAVIFANIALVAYFDASDRGDLIRDVAFRQIMLLEQAALDSQLDPALFRQALPPHFAEHPEAYGFRLTSATGEEIAASSTGLFPVSMRDGVDVVSDWMSWPAGQDVLPVIASHTLSPEAGEARLLFVMRADPANLIAWEVWDEFKGHVLLPLLPITLLLMAGAWLVTRRALRPVADAAAWARRVRPGRPLPDFAEQEQSAEIGDMIDAVRRSLDRLNAELDAEQRRAGEAAHALRTPVAVLVARLDALPEGPQSDTLRADVQALSRTVTQFLSSAGADRLELDGSERADLPAIAHRVVSELAPLALRRGGEIEVETRGTPALVQGSTDAITLALTNLVENAIYHGGAGPITVTVGPGPEIAVRDRGPGLPDVARESLFRPFWRGPGAARGGAGLGLAIVDRIQRSHGGQIIAEPAEGGGAVFRLIYRAA
ncbi:MAG: HAMP domain-containing sensor histidine kinase [Roseovarius sp.]